MLGWVRGSLKVDGRAPAPDAVRDRLALIRHAMDTLFGGRPSAAAGPTSTAREQVADKGACGRSETLGTPSAARQELWWPLAKT